VSSRSTMRSPRSLLEPKEVLRQMTAARSARSLSLLVGSTPSCRLNAQSASQSPSSSSAMRESFLSVPWYAW